MVGSLPDVITYAKFRVEIFRGYDFTWGRISHFPIDFLMGLTTVQRDCAACDISEKVNKAYMMLGITGSTVVLTCCKGDGQSQWKTPIFGPSQLGNPLTDFDKI